MFERRVRKTTEPYNGRLDVSDTCTARCETDVGISIGFYEYLEPGILMSFFAWRQGVLDIMISSSTFWHAGNRHCSEQA
jgi:hypothetical protein